jgi:tRNA pseudouridine(55) synthase
MATKQETYILIWKEEGDTPLQAISKLKTSRPDLAHLPMTYAGRLDPMASGELLILVGQECMNKEHYLNKDKEYEVDILFGFKTDTYDALGMAEKCRILKNIDLLCSDVSKYVGKFMQPYPPYSSKTHNGVQLHNLARINNLPEMLPQRQVEIYSISVLGKKIVRSEDLLTDIKSSISKVRGDFRQEEIVKRWDELFSTGNESHVVMKIRVKCSAGTYMRSLASRIGEDENIGAIALHIKRTKIYL